MNPFLEAIKDGPKTTLGTDSGRVVMTVEASHLTPFDAKIADFEAVLVMFGAVIGGIWMAMAAPDFAVPAAGLFLSGVCGRTYLQRTSRQQSEVTTIVRFTETKIEVKAASAWELNPEWKSFDSRLPHRFVRVPHDWAQHERDEHEYQRRNSPEARLTRYYSDAFIIVLEQLGQRHDIAEVMTAKRADEILTRLTLCDEYMKGIVNERKRLPLRPEDQWSGQTGSVPQ